MAGTLDNMLWTEPDALTPAPKRRQILLAEDDDAMRGLLVEALRAEGFDVTTCHNGLQLMNSLRMLMMFNEAPHYDLIISDIRMPWLDGIKVAEALRDARNVPPMILITAFGDRESHEQALSMGVARVFDKPFEISDLIASIEECLEFKPC